MNLSTIFKGLKDIVHPSYHTQTISSDDVDNWPFTVDQVNVAKQNNYYLYVTIEGKEFALNGITKDHMKYPSVSESEHLKKKGIGHESVAPIIKIAKNLPG